MVTIEIGGKKYPLVLTVAALADLASGGTSLGEVGKFVTMGDGNTVEQMAERTIWLLDVLLRAGRECARRNDPGCAVDAAPDLSDLRHCFTPGQVLLEVRPLVLDAVTASMGRSIEAEPSKNAGHAV